MNCNLAFAHIFGFVYATWVSNLYLEVVADVEIYFNDQQTFGSNRFWFVKIPANHSAIKLFLWDLDIPYSQNCTDCYLRLNQASDGIPLSMPLCNDNSSASIKKAPLTWIAFDDIIVEYLCKSDVFLTPDKPPRFLLSYTNLVRSNYSCQQQLWDENAKCWKFSATIHTRGDTPIKCSWNFQAQTVNHSLQPFFQHFNLDSTKSCAYDYVQIDDISNILDDPKRICAYDQHFPINIISKGPAINIALHISNESVISSVTGLNGSVCEIPHGFLRKVEGVFLLPKMNGKIACNRNSTPSFIFFDSVNSFIWEIYARPGMQITLSWNLTGLPMVEELISLSVLDKLSHHQIDLIKNTSQSLTLNTFHLEIEFNIPKINDDFQLGILYSALPVIASNVLVNSRLVPTTISVELQQQPSQRVWKFKAIDDNIYLRFNVIKLEISSTSNCFDSGLYLYDGDDVKTSNVYGPFCKNNFPLSHFTSYGSYLTAVYYFSMPHELPTLQFSVIEDSCRGITLGGNINFQDVTGPFCYNLQHLSPAYVSAVFDYAEGIPFKIKSQSPLIAHMTHINIHENAYAYPRVAENRCRQYLFTYSFHHGFVCNISIPNPDKTITSCLNTTVTSSPYNLSSTPDLEFYVQLKSSCSSSPISLTGKLEFTDSRLNSNSGFCSIHNHCLSSELISNPCGRLVSPGIKCQYTIGMFIDDAALGERKYGFQHYILQAHKKLSVGSAGMTISEEIYSSNRKHGERTGRDYYHNSKLDYLCDNQIEGSLPSVYRYPTIASDHITITTNNILDVEFQLVLLNDPVNNSSLCQRLKDYYYFNGYCYSYTSDAVRPSNAATWKGAERICKSNGGDLISILTEDEEQFVLDMLSTHWLRSSYGQGTYVAIFIGLEENQDAELRWTDGHPLTFTKWYRPDRPGEMYAEAELNGISNDLLQVISPQDIQPVKDVASKCTVMIVRNPFIGGRWAKIPCDFPFNFPSYICKVPAEHSSDVTSNVDRLEEHVQLKLDNSKCPQKWTYYANKCYLLVTSEIIIGVPLTYHEASALCSNYTGRIANVSDDNLIDSINLLQLWRHRPEYGTILIEKSGDACQELRGSYPNREFNHAEYKLLLMCPEITWQIHQTSCSISFCYNYTCDKRSLYSLSLIPRNVLCEKAESEMIPFCSIRQFECHDGSCINDAWVCDGSNDCLQGEDEEQCDNDCGSLFFRCKNGDCIHMSEYCDFVHQCLDESDESNCIYPNCTENEFRCGNGRCIDRNKTCDFAADCIDSADESEEACSWAETCIQRGGFTCYDGQCLPANMKHDSKMDCRGKTQEDEKYSEKDYKKGPIIISAYSALHSEFIESPFCVNDGALKSRCYTNQPFCFDRSQACIFDVDKNNKAKGCSDLAHLKNCANFTCPGYFKCPNSYCIPLHRVCNNIWDCPGREDESQCQNFACPGNFKCKGETWCLDQSKVCDGQVDCKQFKDDELFCVLGNSCPQICTCRGFTINCTSGGLVRLPNKSEFMRTILFSNNSLNLTEDTFIAHYYVAYLDLSYNGIDSIVPRAFQDMCNLIVLKLVGNSIKVLDNRPFYNLRFIHSLDLQNNGLEHITADAFKGFNGTETMNLKNNYEYMTIDDNAFKDISINFLLTDAFRFCCLPHDNIKNCTPAADEFSSCEDLMSNYVLKVIIWILGIIAYLGNMFVIIWRLKYDKKKVDSFFIIHLSISDCLMGVYLLIIAGADLHYTVQGQYYLYDPIWRQSIGCQIAGFLSSLSCEMSVTMLLLITIDRFIVLVVSFDGKHMSIRHACTITAIGWLFWIVLSALPFMNITYFGNFYGRTAVCLPFTLAAPTVKGLEYTISIFLVFNFLAFVAIAVLYAAIFHRTHRIRKSSGRKINEHDLTLAKRIAIIVATDSLCWIPTIVASTLATAGAYIPKEISTWVAVFILPINSALNPLLYTLSSLTKSEILLRLGVHTKSTTATSTNKNSAKMKDSPRGTSTGGSKAGNRKISTADGRHVPSISMTTPM